MNKKKFIIIITIAFVVVFLPVTVWIIKKNTDSRSRADSTTPTIHFTSPIGSYPSGIALPIDVSLDSNTVPVGIIDIKFSYNPKAVKIVKFLSNKALDSELNSTDISTEQQNKGEFRYHAVDTLGKTITGNNKLGELIVMALLPGTIQIGVSSAQIGTDNSLINIEADPFSIAIVDQVQSTNNNISPSPTLTPTPLPTVANTSGQAQLVVKVIIPGIGSNAQKGENSSPKRTTRIAKVQIYDSQQHLVKSTESTLTYTPSESVYKGTVSLRDIPSQEYTAKISLDNTLVKTLHSTIPLSKNNMYTTVPIILSPGDLNGDGELSITDYNLLQACYRKQPACTTSIAQLADFNDNGVVAGDNIDANIQAREFYSRK